MRLKRYLAPLLLAVVALGSLALVAQSHPAHNLDFRTFYVAGLKANAGQGPSLYDYASYPDSWAWVRPAWQVVIYQPLALLPFRAAFWIWFTLSLTFVALSVWRLRHALAHLSPDWPILLFLALGLPAVFTFRAGQDAPLFLLLVVLAYQALEKGRDVRAGVFLALAAFKPHLLLPAFGFLALKRKWRVLAAAGAIGVLELSVSTIIAGPGWIRGAIVAQGAADDFFSLVCVRGWLRLAGLDELAPLAMAVGYGATFWLLRRARPEVAFAYILPVSVALAWHAFCYDYLVLLLTFAAAAPARALPATLSAARAGWPSPSSYSA